MRTIDACDECLRRAQLIADLSGRIEHEWRLRRGRPRLLGLRDDELLAWGADPEVTRRYEDFRAPAAIARLESALTGAFCRCSEGYPASLRELPDPPAVLHVHGGPLPTEPSVAIVGARRASSYGLEVTRALARGLGVAGVPVVSGMAMGIDSAAHDAALEACGTTVAVLGCGADRPYPARSRRLHGRIVAAGCVVSELPPQTPPRRWTFPARNRLIAALSEGTIVVEGGERSGSLITSDFAAELGCFVGAVPGPVTSRFSAGPHALLKSGAELVRDVEDVLDLLYGVGRTSEPLVVGAGEVVVRAPRAPAVPPDLDPRLQRLLEDVERGHGSLAELVTRPEDALNVARDLGELEVRGLVRRVFGGRYIRTA